MHSPLIIYLEDYATEEQEALNLLGLRTFRLEAPGKDLGDLEPGDVEALIRGPKLRLAVYEALCGTLSRYGILPRTSPASFGALSSSDVYERSIQAHVPDMRTIPIASLSLIQDVSQLNGWGQIFIRSELGSAAKFSGIESCMIRRFDREEVEEKVESLRRAHPTATQLVARRVVDVRKIDGKSVEGRFVVLAGEVRYLDHFEPTDLTLKQPFESVQIQSAATIAKELLRAGIDGDYFIDIAEKQNGGWFVVEIKPLLNGTVRNTAAFAEALLLPTTPKSIGPA